LPIVVLVLTRKEKEKEKRKGGLIGSKKDLGKYL
jgi:hypothetical protein